MGQQKISRKVDIMDLLYYNMDGYIQLRLVFKSDQELKQAIQYLIENLSSLYIKFEKTENDFQLVLDRTMSIKEQIIYHDCKIPCQDKDFRLHFNVVDRNRCAEIHIFQGNTLMLLTHHAVTDGRLTTRLISQIANKEKQKIFLPQSIFTLFNDEFQLYKQQSDQGMFNSKYRNNYLVIDDCSLQDQYIELVQINVNKNPQLHHRLTQKLIIVFSLYKLYVLQKQQKLTNIDQLLKEGIAFNQNYVADIRKYCQIEDADFGFCASGFVQNFLLQADKKVEEYIDYFNEQLKIKVQNKEFCILFYNLVKRSKQIFKVDTSIIQGFQFSNVGNVNSDYYIDAYTNYYIGKKQRTDNKIFMFSFNNVLNISFHCQDVFRHYNITKVITTLLQSIREDITIQELFDKIKSI